MASESSEVPTSLPIFHVAHIVPDLPEAMADLSDALGFRWAEVQHFDLIYETPDGPAECDIRFVYSMEGPPYFEVIEQREMTPWSDLGLHHIGLWGGVNHGTSERLLGLGCPRETVLLNPDGGWAGGLFHLLPHGLRIEIVDESVQPRLRRYMNGGPFRDPDVAEGT